MLKDLTANTIFLIRVSSRVMGDFFAGVVKAIGASKEATKGRGLVSMGSMGSAKPINFERKVLEPINS